MKCSPVRSNCSSELSAKISSLSTWTWPWHLLTKIWTYWCWSNSSEKMIAFFILTSQECSSQQPTSNNSSSLLRNRKPCLRCIWATHRSSRRMCNSSHTSYQSLAWIRSSTDLGTFSKRRSIWSNSSLRTLSSGTSCKRKSAEKSASLNSSKISA